jgi:osmoprotectant transport system permease protein
MGVVADIFGWLTDPANWSGSFGIPARTVEHLFMSGTSVAIGAALALPVALYIGHARRFRFVAVTVANVGRALPSFGILGISFGFTRDWGGSIGFWPTVIALVALAIPPIVTNTYVGIEQVDVGTVEAARGMGQSERQILFGIEIPLAAPLIVTGLRVATVQVVATATLAALVGWGGLGRFIVDGLAVRDFGRIGGGAVLVAVLALVTEGIFTLAERSVIRRTGLSPEAVAPEAITVPSAAHI